MKMPSDTAPAWPGQFAADRFWSNISLEPNSGCWLWAGDYASGGYGRIMVAGKRIKAHRLSAQAFLGLGVDDARIVCHRCDLPACVNPGHLFLGNQQDNMSDAARKGRLVAPVYSSEARKAASDARLWCQAGHPWIAQNIRTRPNGRRECRVCGQIREKLRYKAEGSRWHQRSSEWKAQRKENRRGK